MGSLLHIDFFARSVYSVHSFSWFVPAAWACFHAAQPPQSPIQDLQRNLLMAWRPLADFVGKMIRSIIFKPARSASHQNSSVLVDLERQAYVLATPNGTHHNDIA